MFYACKELSVECGESGFRIHARWVPCKMRTLLIIILTSLFQVGNSQEFALYNCPSSPEQQGVPLGFYELNSREFIDFIDSTGNVFFEYVIIKMDNDTLYQCNDWCSNNIESDTTNSFRITMTAFVIDSSSTFSWQHLITLNLNLKDPNNPKLEPIEIIYSLPDSLVNFANHQIKTMVDQKYFSENMSELHYLYSILFVGTITGNKIAESNYQILRQELNKIGSNEYKRMESAYSSIMNQLK